MSSAALALKPQSSVRWTAPTIGEVCRLINGRAYKKSELLDEGRYRVLRVGNFFTSNHWYFSDLELEDDKYCDDGDLLYAWSASFGPRIWSGNKTIYHYHIWKVEPDPAKVLRNYLFYFFEWDKELIRKEQGAGATMIHVSKGSMEARAIPLPPLDEQKRIVAVLDQAFAALDRARVHAEANLADAEQFFVNSLRAVFSNESKKWASATNAPAVRNSRSSTIAKTRSKASTQTGGREAATRRIEGDYSLSVLQPDAAARPGWVWSSLSDLARLESGHTPSRKHPEYWGGTIGWLGIRDARDHHGGEIFETSEQTNDLGIANSSARILPAGTVCLSRTASVGYVVKMGQAMSTSQDFVNWICGEELEPDFLMLLLLAQGQDIRRFASGSVHQTIYFPEVKAFYVCHPSMATQREICESFKEIRIRAAGLIKAYEQRLADLANLRQSLLQKAFSGELI